MFKFLSHPYDNCHFFEDDFFGYLSMNNAYSTFESFITYNV